MAKETIKTPIMEQYKELKEKHPGVVLLFRIGDFYEVYDEDASKIGKILGVTVTRRLNSKDNGSDGHTLKLAGFPYHALDTYLPKLIRAGVRVAICDRLDSKVTKEYPSDENEAKPETDEVKEHEESQPSEDIDTLKKETANLRAECEELKAKLQEQECRNLDVVQRIVSESIKAVRGELPTILAEYFYDSLGKLEVIKIKNSLNYRLTTDEISYLIEEASKSQNKQN